MVFIPKNRRVRGCVDGPTSTELYHSIGFRLSGGGSTVGVIAATSAGDFPTTSKLRLE